MPDGARGRVVQADRSTVREVILQRVPAVRLVQRVKGQLQRVTHVEWVRRFQARSRESGRCGDCYRSTVSGWVSASVMNDRVSVHHSPSLQAHVCSSVLGCCDNADPTLQLLVEDALFGQRYPLAALPAAACDSAVKAGGGVAACEACRAAVRVELQSDPEACDSSTASTYADAAAAPGRRAAPPSWRERCAFVADLVQVRLWGGGRRGRACPLCALLPPRSPC